MYMLCGFKSVQRIGRMLKVSEIKMSVDKILALAKTITTIQIKLPLNKDFLINRYNSLDDNLAKSVLIRLTKQSKNIKDLIG